MIGERRRRGGPGYGERARSELDLRGERTWGRARTTPFVTCRRPIGGVRFRPCVITARTLRYVHQNAQALRASAVIAVLGGRCAEEVRAMSATVWSGFAEMSARCLRIRVWLDSEASLDMLEEFDLITAAALKQALRDSVPPPELVLLEGGAS